MEKKKFTTDWLLIFFSFSILIFVLDRLTKSLAVRYLYGNEGKTLIKNVLYFVYLENRGAAFGSFQGFFPFFLFITVIVSLVIIYFVLRTPFEKKYIPFIACLISIFGGAMGNFYDRFINRFVVDFIYFSPINFPVFNVADIFVTVGCFLMAALFIFVYKEDDPFLIPKPKE